MTITKFLGIIENHQIGSLLKDAACVLHFTPSQKAPNLRTYWRFRSACNNVAGCGHLVCIPTLLLCTLLTLIFLKCHFSCKAGCWVSFQDEKICYVLNRTTLSWTQVIVEISSKMATIFHLWTRCHHSKTLGVTCCSSARGSKMSFALRFPPSVDAPVDHVTVSLHKIVGSSAFLEGWIFKLQFPFNI